MSDEDLQATIKALLLATNRLHETSSAILLVLKELKLTDEIKFRNARQRVAVLNRELRERMEKLGALDQIEELLRGFDGPIQ
jgi:hypothetical protein